MTDRASAEGLLSDAHWAIETLRRNERTEPDSPFWQGWDAALAAIEVALRPQTPAVPPKTHRAGKGPMSQGQGKPVRTLPKPRLSTPRTETSES